MSFGSFGFLKKTIKHNILVGNTYVDSSMFEISKRNQKSDHNLCCLHKHVIST